MPNSVMRLVVAALVVVGSVTAVTAASGSASSDESGFYVVQLAEKPVVAYEGGVAGQPATKPAKGEKINPHAQHVVNYVNHLDARHDAVLASVGGGQKLYDYRYAYNGFAAKLTSAQAEKLEHHPGVVSVEPVLEWA